MKVILQEPVDRLGNVGDIVTVANGYGRNYLIPTGLAIEANEGNVKYLGHHRRVLDKKRARLQAKGEELKARLEALSLKFERKIGEKGKLFGSVTGKDVADELAARGIELDRRKIDLPETVKGAGTFTAIVALQPGIAAEISFSVVGESEEDVQVQDPVVAEEPAAETPAE
ncbi:MAG: 50S ribosomal protein L9 [Deltaproteobacteria bacterium]|nr:50S ribosomal protein L9 [Candidatus Anaeroferrophillus wilburensis]MBN2888130.1 50S ribosomal protein L9 [Deltaproteobacteria bacterium]